MVVTICVLFRTINCTIDAIRFILDDIMKLFHLPDQEQEAVFALGHDERRGRGGRKVSEEDGRGERAVRTRQKPKESA